MRGLVGAFALVTAACGGQGEPDRNSAAPAVRGSPLYSSVSYAVEGPGTVGKWRVDSHGSGSFDEFGADAQGHYRHLTARIAVGPAGFAEIERLVSALPVGEPHCDDYQESLVAMGWVTVTRERPGQRVETRFDRNCLYRGAVGVAYENVVAAASRMRQWASKASGHKDVLDEKQEGRVP